MISGLSSLSAVAAMLVRDYEKYSMRGATRYTLAQAIEKVCFRRESITSMYDAVPSYLWWHLGVDDGDICPIVDLGKLSGEVNPPEGRRTSRWVWAKEHHTESGAWDTVLAASDCSGEIAIEDTMIKMGLTLGQSFISRAVGSWAHYDDDVDEEYDAEIIYAGNAGQLMIPVMVDNFAVQGNFAGMKIL